MRASKITKKEQIKYLQDAIARRRLICVTSRIYIHVKNKYEVPCPCCGSTESYAQDIREDLQLLINPVTKERKLRRDAKNKNQWDEMAEKAVHHELLLRCTPDGLDILLDMTTPTIGLGGSARAGKTQLALSWIARQWMIRGGRGALFWLIGKNVSHAHLLMNKFLHGSGEEIGRWSPAVLPTEGEMKKPALAISWPVGERTTDQTIMMVDGSEFGLMHANADKVRGRAIQAAVFTEAATVPSNKIYNQLMGRVVSTRGQILIESTFEATNHWTVTELRKKTQDEAVLLEKDPKHELIAKWLSLFAADNPWLSKKAIDVWRESITDDVMMKREFLGIPADGEDKLWSDVWNDDMKGQVFFDAETFDTEQIDEHDITRQVSLSIGFKRPHDFIAGQDINLRPCTTVLCKVTGNYEDKESWKLIIYKVYTNQGRDPYTHAKLLKYFKGGLFANTGIVMDPSACMKNPHASHVGNRNASTIAHLFEQHDFEVLPAKGSLSSPKFIGIKDSVIVCKRLFNSGRIRMERTRTSSLQYAMENQITDDGYRAYKPAGSKHDRLSSSPDAFRYIAWRIFGKSIFKTAPKLWMR